LVIIEVDIERPPPEAYAAVGPVVGYLATFGFVPTVTRAAEGCGVKGFFNFCCCEKRNYKLAINSLSLNSKLRHTLLILCPYFFLYDHRLDLFLIHCRHAVGDVTCLTLKHEKDAVVAQVRVGSYFLLFGVGYRSLLLFHRRSYHIG
jgi:hypothetical protein